MMYKHSLLVKKSLWQLMARIGSLGAMGLFTILLARRLGSAGFGDYASIPEEIQAGLLIAQ